MTDVKDSDKTWYLNSWKICLVFSHSTNHLNSSSSSKRGMTTLIGLFFTKIDEKAKNFLVGFIEWSYDFTLLNI